MPSRHLSIAVELARASEALSRALAEAAPKVNAVAAAARDLTALIDRSQNQ